MAHCDKLQVLFIVTVTCIGLCQVAGLLAWRRRRPGLERARWMVDPTYVFRASWYDASAQPIRRAAATLQVIGTFAGLWVALEIALLLQAGAQEVCGLSF
jgi:hypothetical protein